MPTPTGPQRSKPGRQPQSPQRFGLWWMILILLLIWNLFVFWPHKPHHEFAHIPYSTFVAQVKANNVAKVHIVGASISGTFVTPLLWPQPTAKSNTTPPKTNSTPAPSKNKARPASTPPAGLAQAAAALEGFAQAASTPSPAAHYPKFKTNFPSVVGDARLLPLLEAHHVVVQVSPKTEPWLLDVLVDWVPMLLLILFFWWMYTKTGQNQAGFLNRLGGSKARRYGGNMTRVTFDDVAGADEAKAELQEEVDFLKYPRKYHDLGARIPKGVLLVGPPGTGKTLLARAVAGEAEVPFFSINASEFVQMFVGVGASRVRDLFKEAKAAAPAIVFIDEFDAVGRRRGAGVGTTNDEREQTLNQLLGELDGFEERSEVILLAATNRPDVLDPALLRPGRFDRQVIVPLPDRHGREGILRIHTRKLHLAADVDLAALALSTIGMTGADLANLSNEAALTAARHNRGIIAMADFEEAQEKIRLGAAMPQLINPSERSTIAYHEAGHATVAWITPGADPVQKVTIVPHGQALGLTEQVPSEERHNYSKSFLEGRLAVLLGGRTAEELVFGDVTTGAENDLVEATRLARRMVARWGMGKLGLAAFESNNQQPFLGYELSQGRDYSEATAARIDQEVQRLLDETHEGVRQMLGSRRKQLDQLVTTLLREETLDTHALEQILGPHQQPVGPDERLLPRSNRAS
ncbi:MAG: ATP-dependent zinc metalloprotease FtsH [Candidatus Binataceae bacterium]